MQKIWKNGEKIIVNDDVGVIATHDSQKKGESFETWWQRGRGIIQRDGNPDDRVIVHEVACDTESEPTPLDKVKTAIMELPAKDRHEIYKFLYALGHRISQ